MFEAPCSLYPDISYIIPWNLQVCHSPLVDNGRSSDQLADLDAGSEIKMKNYIKPEKLTESTFTD